MTSAVAIFAKVNVPASVREQRKVRTEDKDRRRKERAVLGFDLVIIPRSHTPPSISQKEGRKK